MHGADVVVVSYLAAASKNQAKSQEEGVYFSFEVNEVSPIAVRLA